MHRLQAGRTLTSLTPGAGTSPTPQADKSLTPRAFIPVGVAAVSIGLDQLTKTLAQNALSDGPVDLFLGMRFTLAYNSGAAFSVGSGRSGIFTVLALVVVSVLTVYAVWSKQPVSRRVMFGLIIGGAAGNLVDRLFRGNGGAVIDFIEFADWYPVCNVADVSLFFGVVLMLWLTFREERAGRAGNG